MKLEYLTDTNLAYPEDSIVRLYDFSAAEVTQLISIFRRLSQTKGLSIALAGENFIEAIGGCQLLLKSGEADRGITQIIDDGRFECELTPKSWEQAMYLAEPFLNPKPNTFQWLYDLVIPIDFLLSQDGGW